LRCMDCTSGRRASDEPDDHGSIAPGTGVPDDRTSETRRWEGHRAANRAAAPDTQEDT